MVLYAANTRCAPRSGRREPTVANEPFLQVRGRHSAENNPTDPDPRRADGRRSFVARQSAAERVRGVAITDALPKSTAR